MRVRPPSVPSSRGRAVAAAATVALTVVAVIAGLVGAPAGADPRSDKEKADRTVRDLRHELSESTARLAAAEAAYAAAEAQLSGARADLAQAEGALAAARALEVELVSKVRAAEAAQRRAEATLVDLNEGVAAREAELGAVVRQAYQQGPVPELVLAFDAETLRDYADRMAYLDQIATAQNEVIRKIRNERAAAASAAALLEERRRDVAAQRAAATKQVQERQAAEEAARAASARVEALTAEKAAAVEVAEQEREEDLRRYEEMQAEAKRLEQLVAAEIAREAAAQREASAKKKSSSSSSVKAAPGATLAYPVRGPVTSPYGRRFHPILKYWKLHTGTDFGAPSGTSVRAARAGKVIQSGWNNAYGNRVVISHGYVKGVHLTTTYNHLSSRAVRVGERVDQGELVGRVGSTGYSTGPHLHFEVLVDGEFRNPMTWL